MFAANGQLIEARANVSGEILLVASRLIALTDQFANKRSNGDELKTRYRLSKTSENYRAIPIGRNL